MICMSAEVARPIRAAVEVTLVFQCVWPDLTKTDAPRGLPIKTHEIDSSAATARRPEATFPPSCRLTFGTEISAYASCMTCSNAIYPVE